MRQTVDGYMQVIDELRVGDPDADLRYSIIHAYMADEPETYDDDIRGSLEPGKPADLVVLDADLLSVPDAALLTMGDRVMLTMVGGHVEFRRDGFALPPYAR